MSKLLKKLCLIIPLGCLSGCATLQFEDFFVSYDRQMKPVREAVEANDFNQAQLLLGTRSTSNTSYTLNLLENGRIAHLDGNYEQSKQWFEQAYQQLEEERAKAKVQVSQGVEKFSAMVSNDSAISYQIPAYEQSMMHSYQALNYLYLGHLESALVEVRRANLVQVDALQKRSNELAEAQAELGDDIDINWQQANAAFTSLNSRIGELKNGIQNAYTFYLSGILYEGAGQDNDAYIDYKKALEIFPDNAYLQQDVLRLAHQLVMTNDIETLEARFGKYERKALKNGELIVIYEQNLIDSRVEQPVNLPIFTRHNDFRTFSFSLPTYRATHYSAQPLVLSLAGETKASEQIVHLQALVAKQLQEQMPSMIARQALRLVAKEQVRRQLQDQGGDFGNIVAGLYNMASERADTRSWLTLPGDVQILRTTMAPGTTELNINAVPGLSSIPVDINSGRITLVLINKLGSQASYNVVNL
jgi:uncharacterized protein